MNMTECAGIPSRHSRSVLLFQLLSKVGRRPYCRFDQGYFKAHVKLFTTLTFGPAKDTSPFFWPK